MEFIEFVKSLQEEDYGRLVLVRCGVFYLEIGKDAVILNDLLGLKFTCYKQGICRAGFPENALEKYVNELKKDNIAIVIYNYTEDSHAKLEYNGKKYEVLLKMEGKEIVVENFCKDCTTCKSAQNRNAEEKDVVIIQVLKLTMDLMNRKMDMLLKQIEDIGRNRPYERK